MDYMKPTVSELAGQIISAYASNNVIDPLTTPELIDLVSRLLARLDGSGVTITKTRPKPAVSIKESVYPDYIVCLEDGKRLKMLKRHLRISYGMTPAQYRERWGLPDHYPMVAPGHAQKRSELAKKHGLGQRP